MSTIKNERLFKELTKSELLLLKIGKLVECDICHNQVFMGTNWMMTTKRDNNSKFINKKAVCPNCQPSVLAMGELMVSI
jgi:hypothetical protein